MCLKHAALVGPSLPPYPPITLPLDMFSMSPSAALVRAAAILAAVAAAVPAAAPNGKTYCCGVGSGPDCGGPDWTPLQLVFNANATTVKVSITIDGTASSCAAEACSVNSTALEFPNLAKDSDCLGQILRGTGALTGDLQVAYDPSADSFDLSVNSEGVEATLKAC
eukprot:gene11745-2139_t